MNIRIRYALAAAALVSLTALSYACAINPWLWWWSGMQALTGMVALGFVAGACAMAALLPNVERPLTLLVLWSWSTSQKVARWIATVEVRKEARPTEATWAVLAGCRMFLATVVVCGHLAFFYPEYGILRCISKINASDAVLLFLFISGFSIADSVSGRPEQYYARRFWRIVPVYVAVIAFSFAPYLFVNHVSEPHGPSTLHLPTLSSALSVASFGFLRHVDTDGPVWSLGIEAVWYILAPLLVRLRPALVLTIAAGSCWYWERAQWHSLHQQPSTGSWIVFGVVSWAWLLGFAFYRLRAKLWAYTLLAVPAYMLLHARDVDMGGVWPAALFGATVMIAVNLPTINRRVSSCLKWLGDISYPLYIAHMPVFWLLISLRTGNAIVAFCLASGMAVAVFYVVDLPFRQHARKVLSRSRPRKALPNIYPATAAAGSEKLTV